MEDSPNDPHPSSETTSHPKKQIKLGVVQSSNVGIKNIVGVSNKKNRWDQAPDGDDEEPSVINQDSLQVKGEADVPGVKSLIKKFEDFSENSNATKAPKSIEKDDTSKTVGGGPQTPSRVKLVRTNFTKTGQSSSPTPKPPIVSNKLDSTSITELPITVEKDTDPSSDSVKAALPVTPSSKALQIISSCYDSGDDLSPEEDTPSKTDRKSRQTGSQPTDSANAPLDKSSECKPNLRAESVLDAPSVNAEESAKSCDKIIETTQHSNSDHPVETHPIESKREEHVDEISGTTKTIVTQQGIKDKLKTLSMEHEKPLAQTITDEEKVQQEGNSVGTLQSEDRVSDEQESGNNENLLGEDENHKINTTKINPKGPAIEQSAETVGDDLVSIKSIGSPDELANQAVGGKLETLAQQNKSQAIHTTHTKCDSRETLVAEDEVSNQTENKDLEICLKEVQSSDSDLGVLRVDTDKLKTLPIDPSKQLEVPTAQEDEILIGSDAEVSIHFEDQDANKIEIENCDNLPKEGKTVLIEPAIEQSVEVIEDNLAAMFDGSPDEEDNTIEIADNSESKKTQDIMIEQNLKTSDEVDATMEEIFFESDISENLPMLGDQTLTGEINSKPSHSFKNNYSPVDGFFDPTNVNKGNEIQTNDSLLELLEEEDATSSSKNKSSKAKNSKNDIDEDSSDCLVKNTVPYEEEITIEPVNDVDDQLSSSAAIEPNMEVDSKTENVQCVDTKLISDSPTMAVKENITDISFTKTVSNEDLKEIPCVGSEHDDHTQLNSKDSLSKVYPIELHTTKNPDVEQSVEDNLTAIYDGSLDEAAKSISTADDSGNLISTESQDTFKESPSSSKTDNTVDASHVHITTPLTKDSSGKVDPTKPHNTEKTQVDPTQSCSTKKPTELSVENVEDNLAAMFDGSLDEAAKPISTVDKSENITIKKSQDKFEESPSSPKTDNTVDARHVHITTPLTKDSSSKVDPIESCISEKPATGLLVENVEDNLTAMFDGDKAVKAMSTVDNAERKESQEELKINPSSPGNENADIDTIKAIDLFLHDSGKNDQKISTTTLTPESVQISTDDSGKLSGSTEPVEDFESKQTALHTAEEADCSLSLRSPNVVFKGSLMPLDENSGLSNANDDSNVLVDDFISSEKNILPVMNSATMDSSTVEQETKESPRQSNDTTEDVNKKSVDLDEPESVTKNINKEHKETGNVFPLEPNSNVSTEVTDYFDKGLKATDKNPEIFQDGLKTAEEELENTGCAEHIDESMHDITETPKINLTVDGDCVNSNNVTCMINYESKADDITEVPKTTNTDNISDKCFEGITGVCIKDTKPDVTTEPLESFEGVEECSSNKDGQITINSIHSDEDMDNSKLPDNDFDGAGNNLKTDPNTNIIDDIDEYFEIDTIAEARKRDADFDKADLIHSNKLTNDRSKAESQDLTKDRAYAKSEDKMCLDSDYIEVDGTINEEEVALKTNDSVDIVEKIEHILESTDNVSTISSVDKTKDDQKTKSSTETAVLKNQEAVSKSGADLNLTVQPNTKGKIKDFAPPTNTDVSEHIINKTTEPAKVVDFDKIDSECINKVSDELKLTDSTDVFETSEKTVLDAVVIQNDLQESCSQLGDEKNDNEKAIDKDNLKASGETSIKEDVVEHNPTNSFMLQELSQSDCTGEFNKSNVYHHDLDKTEAIKCPVNSTNMPIEDSAAVDDSNKTNCKNVPGKSEDSSELATNYQASKKDVVVLDSRKSDELAVNIDNNDKPGYSTKQPDKAKCVVAKYENNSGQKVQGNLELTSDLKVTQQERELKSSSIDSEKQVLKTNLTEKTEEFPKEKVLVSDNITLGKEQKTIESSLKSVDDVTPSAEKESVSSSRDVTVPLETYVDSKSSSQKPVTAQVNTEPRAFKLKEAMSAKLSKLVDKIPLTTGSPPADKPQASQSTVKSAGNTKEVTDLPPANIPQASQPTVKLGDKTKEVTDSPPADIPEASQPPVQSAVKTKEVTDSPPADKSEASHPPVQSAVKTKEVTDSPPANKPEASQPTVKSAVKTKEVTDLPPANIPQASQPTVKLGDKTKEVTDSPPADIPEASQPPVQSAVKTKEVTDSPPADKSEASHPPVQSAVKTKEVTDSPPANKPEASQPTVKSAVKTKEVTDSPPAAIPKAFQPTVQSAGKTKEVTDLPPADIPEASQPTVKLAGKTKEITDSPPADIPEASQPTVQSDGKTKEVTDSPPADKSEASQPPVKSAVKTKEVTDSPPAAIPKDFQPTVQSAGKTKEVTDSPPADIPEASQPSLKLAVKTKEVPPPVRVSARQKQRQAAAAALAAEKAKSSPEPSTKKAKKSVSPSQELHIKISNKPLEASKQSPLASPKHSETKTSQMSPKIVIKELGQEKLEPITLKLSKEDNPVIVKSLSPKRSSLSPQTKTLGYTLKIGKDSTTIIPKDPTLSPKGNDSSSTSSVTKVDSSSKVGYFIKDTGLTITPVSSDQDQKLNRPKITLKLAKSGGSEVKQEKSETWKAIQKLGEIDIVPVEGKSTAENLKRKEKSDSGSPDKKVKLADVTVEPSTSSGMSKLQGLLTQAPLNHSDDSSDVQFMGFVPPTEKVRQTPSTSRYDIGMIKPEMDPQPVLPKKRGRPRKISSPDREQQYTHTLPSGLTAKDILAASLQHQTLQQHLQMQQMQHMQQIQQQQQQPEAVECTPTMFPVPLFDLSEDTYMEPPQPTILSPPTIFPDQVQPESIMRSARGRPIGRSRRSRGASSLLRGSERGPRGRPRGSRGMKRMMEEMHSMMYSDMDEPITLENIDSQMGLRFTDQQHGSQIKENTLVLLRKTIEVKKENQEKRQRRSDGSDDGNRDSDIDAKVREMKEKIEAAYQAELKTPRKILPKKSPDKHHSPDKSQQAETSKKSSSEVSPSPKKEGHKQTEGSEEKPKRKSVDGKSPNPLKRKLSNEQSEDSPSKKIEVENVEDASNSILEDSQQDLDDMDVDQPDSPEQTKPEEKVEPPPKPVKPKAKSKAEIKRIKREKDRLRREAKKLAALEALKAAPPPPEEDTRMSASDPNGEMADGDILKKPRMEVEGETKEFTVDQIAEYQWPLQGGELYMIQEQISTYLGVKSFKRKYPEIKRRPVEMEERTFLCDSGLVSEAMCDLGLTAVSSSEVLDIMFQDFQDQYEELRKSMREKQARELINKQKERKKFEQSLSKSDLKEHAIQSAQSWNQMLNRNRTETRKCHLDLQTWTIQYPRSKWPQMTRPVGKLGNYPVALIPGQYCDYYKEYTPQELRYWPVNTVLYGPLQPNERESNVGSEGSQSESEDSSSSDDSSDTSSDEATECEDREKGGGGGCKACGGGKRAGEGMVSCSQCGHHIHMSCADLTSGMLARVRSYAWQCSVCKTCQMCKKAENESKMLFCDSCDRGYHSYCVGLRRVPYGSWTCQLCRDD